eukprot:TRINITY_DN6424_c2_g1_i1.p1 TRINITY_DN6424_c2_g1~~TRINITY_DN6424_c2_g1_i1.p1  ORF type:complete len:774 (-),score=124.77 TRINITY_DN6424_c2_g1_i1:30-2351(-)
MQQASVEAKQKGGSNWRVEDPCKAPRTLPRQLYQIFSSGECLPAASKELASVFLAKLHIGDDVKMAQQLEVKVSGILAEGFQICVSRQCWHSVGSLSAVAMLLLVGGDLVTVEKQLEASLGMFVEMQQPGSTRTLIDKCFKVLMGSKDAPGEAATPSLGPSLKLNSGFELARLAFGTNGLGDLTTELVQEAFAVGFRALDCATHPQGGEGFSYDQKAVGNALAQNQLARHSIFLSTKIHPADFGFKKAIAAVERALEDLGPAAGGYIDLVLLHFPICSEEYCPRGGSLRPMGDFLDAWHGLERAVSQGLVRSLGVSNFDAMQLQELTAAASIKPAVAGLWADAFHPPAPALRRLCERHDIRLQVFGVLGFEWSQGRGARGHFASRSSPLMNHPDVRKIARDKGWSAADVLITYFLQQGIAVITTSSKPERLRELYADHLARELLDEEMSVLRDLEGFLDSSIRLQASQDFYHGMIGFDTLDMHSASADPATSNSAWRCSAARETYANDGVIQLQDFFSDPAVNSARRAVQKLVSDHGGWDLEDSTTYPESLCAQTDIPAEKLTMTHFNYIFPMVQAVRNLAQCLLFADEPVIYYLLLRGKGNACEKADIPWHQDSSYMLQVATRARTYDEAEPDLAAFAGRSLTLHLPLTEETLDRGAMTYAVGSHNQGLHPAAWIPQWLGDAEAPEYEYGPSHPHARPMPARPGDLLAHSPMVHHGSMPNPSNRMRWHLEIGLQDALYESQFKSVRPGIPSDASFQSQVQFVQEMSQLRLWD